MRSILRTTVFVMFAAHAFAADMHRTGGKSFEEDTIASSMDLVQTEAALKQQSIKASMTRRSSAEAEPGQAPFVLQLAPFGHRDYPGWMQATDNIPVGTQVQFCKKEPGRNSSERTPNCFPTREFKQGLNKGEWYTLPTATTGNFGPIGIVMYELLVQVPGKPITHAAMDFVVGDYKRTTEDMARFVPYLRSYRVERQSGGVILVLSGVFTEEKPVGLVETWVVPDDAISLVNAGEVRINLSKLDGFQFDSPTTNLVTVSQHGWSDTISILVGP